MISSFSESGETKVLGCWAGTGGDRGREEDVEVGPGDCGQVDTLEATVTLRRVRDIKDE